MKKKLIGLLASTGILFSFFAVGQFGGAKLASADSNAFDANGAGTQSNPWLISSKEQWEDLAARVNDITPLNLSGKYIKLTTDISVGGTVVGKSTSNSFKGHFDGNDHTITVGFADAENSYTSLFGIVDSGATIKNLTVTGTFKVKESAAIQYYGGIAGLNKGTIEECKNQVKMTAKGTSSKYFGGIVGSNEGTISNCETEGSFAANDTTSYGGGIAGINSGVIRDCTNDAPYPTSSNDTSFNVGDSFNCGGIVGVNNANGKIYHCSNAQYLKTVAHGHNVGGIAGTNNGEIYNSFNTGKIDANGTFIGGIVGENTAKLYNSYNQGAIAIANEKDGGVFGVNAGSIINVMNYGSITNPSNIEKSGGFGGINQEAGTFVNAFEGSTTKITVLGEQKGESTPLKMNRSQVTASHACRYTGEDTLFEGKALVDILNEYIDDEANTSVTSNFEYWTKTFNAIPLPQKDLYKVVIKDCENGSLIVASNYVPEGEEFRIECTPNEGYELDKLFYGNDEENIDNDISSKRHITMPANDVVISGSFKEVHVHHGVKTEAKEPTCLEDGHKEYYKCSCGNYYDTEKCDLKPIAQNEDELAKWLKGSGKILHDDHFLSYVKAQEAKGSKDGFNACYYCKKCGTYFEDMFGEYEIGDATAYEAWKAGNGCRPATGVSIGLTVGLCVAGVAGACLLTYIIMYIVWVGSGSAPGFLKGSFKAIHSVFHKEKKPNAPKDPKDTKK